MLQNKIFGLQKVLAVMGQRERCDLRRVTSQLDIKVPLWMVDSHKPFLQQQIPSKSMPKVH